MSESADGAITEDLGAAMLKALAGPDELTEDLVRLLPHLSGAKFLVGQLREELDAIPPFCCVPIRPGLFACDLRRLAAVFEKHGHKAGVRVVAGDVPSGSLFKLGDDVLYVRRTATDEQSMRYLARARPGATIRQIQPLRHTRFAVTHYHRYSPPYVMAEPVTMRKAVLDGGAVVRLGYSHNANEIIYYVPDNFADYEVPYSYPVFYVDDNLPTLPLAGFNPNV